MPKQSQSAGPVGRQRHAARLAGAVAGGRMSPLLLFAAPLNRLLSLVLLPLFLALFMPGASAQASKAGEPVRISMTPLAIDDQVAFLKLWGDYLEKRLQRPVVFVQGSGRRAVEELLHRDQVDFAWVSGYHYVRSPNWMKLVAVPVFEHKSSCQSYLIVPSDDARTGSLLNLRNKVFAYPDPAGYLYTQFTLARHNEKPGEFFSKSFSTGTQRDAVEAVAVGLAAGGAVDGCVWDALSKTHPEVTARTRIVQKSPGFGSPPFAARASISRDDFDAMQKVLLEMDSNPEGAEFLRKLALDGFAVADPGLFDGIADMARTVNGS